MGGKGDEGGGQHVLGQRASQLAQQLRN